MAITLKRHSQPIGSVKGPFVAMRDRVTVIGDDGSERDAEDEFWVGLDNGGSFYRIVTEARGSGQAETLANGLNDLARQLASGNRNEVEVTLSSFPTGEKAIEVLTVSIDDWGITRYQVRYLVQDAEGGRTLQSSAVQAIDMASYLRGRKGPTPRARQPSSR